MNWTARGSLMRTWLDKTYEIVAGPAAPTWDTYQAVVMQAWTALLARAPSEAGVQSYLERHPGLLPGYRSMTITSGHTCFPAGVITHPPLAGLSKKIPDFMWIASASDSIFRALGSIAPSSIAKSAGSRSPSYRCRQCCRTMRSPRRRHARRGLGQRSTARRHDRLTQRCLLASSICQSQGPCAT